jgi:glycosyltransferase involved in cell wall biosynthesis
MRVKDEADWARLSIISILDFADEIVFVDNGSTDGTLEKVRELKDGFGLKKLNIHTFPPIDGVKIKANDLYNFSFGLASKSWVFKWDGDFIARTEQLYSIMELKDLWGEYRHRADVFRIGGPNLFGDHLHYFYGPPDDDEFCFERYLWRNRRWKHAMHPHYEILVLKAHRRIMHLGPMAHPDDRRVYFFHMKGLKPDDKVANRSTLSLWWKYCQERPRHDKTYEQWLADFWGTKNRKEQIKKCMELFFKGDRIRRFEKIGGDWGEYPTLLKPYLNRPRYEVVYRGGKPSRRVTHHDRSVPLPGRWAG